ncbi:hypothetical protein Gohar_022244 [Gossypium harknessii]|uniref:Uncharacterized protein n=1 Tax=Gossypium harknessii TaxID=34285 RepID=A0A7J9IC94_9ROSI|nr:hypothetical protein [Gossypium harknessii]
MWLLQNRDYPNEDNVSDGDNGKLIEELKENLERLEALEFLCCESMEEIKMGCTSCFHTLSKVTIIGLTN